MDLQDSTEGRIVLELTDINAITGSMEDLAIAISKTDTNLDKTLFNRFQELLNETYEIDLQFNVDGSNVYDVTSIDELPVEMQNKEFIKSVFKKYNRL